MLPDLEAVLWCVLSQGSAGMLSRWDGQGRYPTLTQSCWLLCWDPICCGPEPSGKYSGAPGQVPMEEVALGKLGLGRGLWGWGALQGGTPAPPPPANPCDGSALPRLCVFPAA